MLLQDHMASKNYLKQETTTHSIKLIYQSLTIFLQNKVHFENIQKERLYLKINNGSNLKK